MGLRGATTTAPAMTRRFALVAGFVIAATVMIVAVGGFYWAQTDAPSRSRYSDVGVAKLPDGQVSVVVSNCLSGIAELEIVDDTVDAEPLKVSAGPNPPSRAVSVSAADRGYEYAGPLVDPTSDDRMRLRVILDGKGVNRITKKPLTWRSFELANGVVQMADGTQALLEEWQSGHAC